LKELDSLIDAGFAAAGAGQNFLTNQLVVILPEGNPGKVLSLQDLARPGVRLVFAAKEAPVGSYTLTVLANLESAFGPGYPQQVLHQVGSYEGDAKQVVAKVRLGEADAGIAYRSDAAAAPELLTLAIPNEANVAARYPIAPLLQSKQPELAHLLGMFFQTQARRFCKNGASSQAHNAKAPFSPPHGVCQQPAWLFVRAAQSDTYRRDGNAHFRPAMAHRLA
jgi:ABC-type molybdate transport system substrate-binding protein